MMSSLIDGFFLPWHIFTPSHLHICAHAYPHTCLRADADGRSYGANVRQASPHIALILLKFSGLKSSKFFLLSAIAWSVISTILLTLPGSQFPKEDWLSKIWFDKWVHIFMFALLAWLWCMSLPEKTRFKFWIIGGVCLLYGVIMELVQGNLIPNRSFDAGDIVADAVGSIVGVVYSTRRYIKK